LTDRTRTLPRARLLLAAVAVIALEAVAPRGPAVYPLNARRVPSMRLSPFQGRAGFLSTPGTIGIGSPLGAVPTGPVTLLDARPLSMTPGVELVAARVLFYGSRFGTSPGGYRTLNGYPGVVCSGGVTGGFGPTYPVEGRRLAPNDAIRLVFYVRASRVGFSAAVGYRLRYRTESGDVVTITGNESALTLDLRERADLEHHNGQCRPETKEPSSWTAPAPGFPP
jgi:hypothetical protein